MPLFYLRFAWLCLCHTAKAKRKKKVPPPGFEPGLLRPQRRVLTTRLRELYELPSQWQGVSLVSWGRGLQSEQPSPDMASNSIPGQDNVKRFGAAEACWAHNPKVRGSKPRIATFWPKRKPTARIELATFCLQGRCTTTMLRRRTGCPGKRPGPGNRPRPRQAQKARGVNGARFELAPPWRLVPKTSALDRSAIRPAFYRMPYAVCRGLL